MNDTNDNGVPDGEEQRRTRGLRPPWQPGQSGNPNGRPKGLTLVERLRRKLEQSAKDAPYVADVAAKLGIDPEDADVADVLVGAILHAAMQGNSSLIGEVWNRLEGKSTDKLEVTTNRLQELAAATGQVIPEWLQPARREPPLTPELSAGS